METSLINKAIEVFMRHHGPADSLGQCGQTLSTREIMDIFEDLLGEGNIKISELTELLTSNGYIFEYFKDEGFRWMLRSD